MSDATIGAVYDWTRAVFPEARTRELFNAGLLTVLTMIFAFWLVIAFSWWQVGWLTLAFLGAALRWYRYWRVRRS